jgi:hypothetical protein
VSGERERERNGQAEKEKGEKEGGQKLINPWSM